MKKFIFSLFLLLSFSVKADETKFTVLTSFTIIADIAKNIAGDDANVVSLTKPGAEIHNYEPTPQDLVLAQQANLILYNGLNLEAWFERFLQDLKSVPAIVVTDGVKALPITSGAYKDTPNPHAWMSIKNAEIYVNNIEKALSKYDPKNSENYQKRAKDYLHKLKTLETEIKTVIERIPVEQRWLVTSEGAFSYWTEDFGFKEAYLWAINSEQQGTAQQIRDLIQLVKKENIPVVFSESTLSDKPAKQVAAESKALYGGVLYVDSLSEADGAVPTYLDLLRVTSETIVNALEKVNREK